MRYLSKEQVVESIQNAAKSNSRNYLLINLLAKTGMRVSEVPKLTPNDVLADEEQLIVRGKGNVIRNIDVPVDLIMLLEMYQKDNKIKSKESFIKIGSRAIRYRTHELAGANPHAFRHTYAINLTRKTKNLRYVQKQLGHKSLQTTQIYLQFMEFSDDRKKLGGLYA